MTGALHTHWLTDDEQIARILTQIEQERDPVVRLELLAALHTWQAHDCIRQAEGFRALRARRERRR